MSFVKETCRLGSGETCCRYLVVGAQGFECGKFDPSISQAIAKRIEAGTFNAKGDNCEGKPRGEILP